MAKVITVYDLNLQKTAFLQNAFTVGYEQPLNGIWTASFSLPANDPKNAECKPLHYIELFDGDERLDLFRILPNTAKRSTDGFTITYDCEHVIGTLLDDILFQFHTIGNLGVYTEDVLQYILDRQTVQRWQIGAVSIARQFEYTWENETLWAAILSVPKPFDVDYMWTWDTSTYPWTLNLVQPSNDVQAYIRYGRNMQGITKTVDPSNICTRLYCLGYGEGVNQLGIAEINGGLPYLDSDNQDDYGIVTRVLVDRRFTSAETLKAFGQKLLAEAKLPRTTYTVQASELFAITKDPIDRFATGSMVRVIDDELGEDVTVRVVNKRKADVYGKPGNVELEIANRPLDLAGTIAKLQQKQYINDVYAQGSTNWDSHDFADNCDPDHPVILKFWVPDEAVRINKLMLSYECKPFRGYSKAIAAAPAVTSGPSSVTTTQQTDINGTTEVGSVTYDTSGGASNGMSDQGAHNHGIAPGTELAVVGGGSVTWVPANDHRHTIRYHWHSFDAAPHVHEMDHTHTIPAHTHEIEFGIFEGATPTDVTVKVDGNTISELGTDESDIDLVDYLSKDSDGRIQRGKFHEIEIAPNSLGRIVATVVTQIFVQSRGGGDY